MTSGIVTNRLFISHTSTDQPFAVALERVVKKLVADQALDNAILKEAAKGNF